MKPVLQIEKSYLEPALSLGQFFLTHKFVSQFSRHWDKIFTNGLLHRVPLEFAYLGKLLTVSGNGRSRDRHVTSPGNTKWAL